MGPLAHLPPQAAQSLWNLRRLGTGALEGLNVQEGLTKPLSPNYMGYQLYAQLGATEEIKADD